MSERSEAAAAKLMQAEKDLSGTERQVKMLEGQLANARDREILRHHELGVARIKLAASRALDAGVSEIEVAPILARALLLNEAGPQRTEHIVVCRNPETGAAGCEAATGVRYAEVRLGRLRAQRYMERIASQVPEERRDFAATALANALLDVEASPDSNAWDARLAKLDLEINPPPETQEES